MKLALYDEGLMPKIGIVLGERIIKAEEALKIAGIGEIRPDYGDSRSLIKIATSEELSGGFQRLNAWLEKNFSLLPEKASFDAATAVLCPPIPDAPMICGLVGNCAQFWRDRGENIATYPIGFIRPSTSLSGHNQVVTVSPFCSSFRFAVELGVIFGKDCKDASPENAMDYVSGYTCVNDMISDSWKDLVMERSGSKNPSFYEYLATSYYGRGTDGFAPCGPYFVSKDEIEDHYNLQAFTRLNGKLVDRSYSNALIVGIEQAISQLSSYAMIPAGSILHMGTMGTDGFTIGADQYLTRDDFLEIEIEKIGKLRTYINDQRSRK
jgi:2-keto-4-pentenoate hydratase/2-oxohepta-3-ene-1,7-dioic acid hydratase in catechol pathway